MKKTCVSVGLLIFISWGLTACSDPVEDCVSKLQDQYRAANPKADYGAASTANEKFRQNCEFRYKKR